ncbi:hypothetical protein FQA39_LY04025 [Lamprigera yunnana]|nr:hypothetical protein FQA39_LY04025 [Lamprigera yunnana]
MLRKNVIAQYKLNYKKLLTLKKQLLPEIKEVTKLTSRFYDVLQQNKQNVYAFIAQRNASNYNTLTERNHHSGKQIKLLGFDKYSINNEGSITDLLKKRALFCTAAVSAASSGVVDNVGKESSIVIEPIPEPPPILETDLLETINQLNALGEPTLTSLGLANWTPVGFVQSSLEYLHVTFDIPWWGAIVIGTVIVRLLMFPLVIISQRNASRMNNYLPQLQAIQVKMTEARQRGNHMDTARYSQEMVLFMKEKGLNPLKNMIVPLAQMPLFVSFFMGLRKMANLPVESMQTGGMLWFTDLTVPDQFYILPIVTSITLWITIEVGTDSAKLSSQNLQTMKYVLRALPICILPFIVNFPGAILCYWTASNFISLAQVGFLKIPSVREYFKIEALLKHNPSNLPIQSKGFFGGLQDSWTNAKITRQLEDRRRYDDLQFQRAGRGAVMKTFKYDPTKQLPPNAISAKKR